jgi:hypothetical protein
VLYSHKGAGDANRSVLLHMWRARNGLPAFDSQLDLRTPGGGNTRPPTQQLPEECTTLEGDGEAPARTARRPRAEERGRRAEQTGAVTARVGGVAGPRARASFRRDFARQGD